ncbi:MAG: hypothetical protein ABIO91_07020 [Pyrinomonadaceae bacterium]
MKTISLFLVVIGIALLSNTAGFGQASKEVVVTNTAAAPVLVKSVDDPARRALQLGFEVNSPNTVTTPVGKIFVVEHVSGTFRLKTQAGATMPCKFFELALPVSGTQASLPESYQLIPTDMGTTPSLGFDLSFYSINHAMKLYFRPATELGGMSFTMGGSCTSSPIFYSRIVLSGYLVDSQ